MAIASRSGARSRAPAARPWSAGIDMAVHLVGRLGSPDKACKVRRYIQRPAATLLSPGAQPAIGDGSRARRRVPPARPAAGEWLAGCVAG